MALNEHAAYIERTHQGGLASYTNSLAARLVNASNSGDANAVAKINAEAARIGVSLPTVTVSNKSGGSGYTGGYIPTGNASTSSGSTVSVGGVSVNTGQLGNTLGGIGQAATGAVETAANNFGFTAIVGLGVAFLVTSLITSFGRVRR